MTQDDGSGSGDGSEENGGREASPVDASLRSRELPDSVRCPFCETMETEQFAAFGSALSVSQYYCRRCRTVFEAVKWRNA